MLARPCPATLLVDDAALNDGPHVAVTARDGGRRKQQISGVSAAAPPPPNEESRPLLLLLGLASSPGIELIVAFELNRLRLFGAKQQASRPSGRIGNQKSVSV